MQVTETLNEGLKRKLSVVIPKNDLSTRLDARLGELKDRANIKGFRPGKVPTTYLKKVYGKSAMAEVMQDAINATVSNALTERSERAAAQPKVDLPEDQSDLNKVLDKHSVECVQPDEVFCQRLQVVPKRWIDERIDREAVFSRPGEIA